MRSMLSLNVTVLVRLVARPAGAGGLGGALELALLHPFQNVRAVAGDTGQQVVRRSTSP